MRGVIPPGVTVSHVRIIAGYGVRDVFRNAGVFAEKHNNDAGKWQKVGGIIETDYFTYDVHWYQYADSSTQYDAEIKGVMRKK